MLTYTDGGAYQIGSAAIDPVDFVLNNNNRFITVFIQYRVRCPYLDALLT